MTWNGRSVAMEATLTDSSVIELPYLAKPLKGQPCNGCGFCCAQEVCAIGKEVHGNIPGPCPSIVYKDGRTYCGVIRWAGPQLGEALANLLGIGKGCCSDDLEFLSGR